MEPQLATMAAWEPPINPFTGSPETPDARLPPSLRPRMGKGRDYVLLAVDAHGEWRGTGAACDTPAAAEQAWLAQRGRGCALLRLGASGWEVLRARGPDDALDRVKLAPGLGAAAAAIFMEDHGVVRARYYATAAAAEAAWRWLPLHFASALFPVWKSNLQPDFNVRVFEEVDTRSSALLRELDESDRFVQKSAESTSIWPR